MAYHLVDLDPFDPASVRNANREMRKLLREFDKKVDVFLADIAVIGQKAAQGAYGGGGAVTVTVQPIDNGYAIIANGDAVVFLEFGAGDAVDQSDRYVSVVEAEGGFDIRPGSWSEQNAQQYSTLGYWIFGGQKYTEVQPRNGMQVAYEAIMQDMRNAAQRAFG